MLIRSTAAALLIFLSAFGFKSLHLFASSNGLLGRLEKCITNGTTPGGKPLQTLTTNGRFPAIDLQLRAVAVFLLISYEDLEHLDADVVGIAFAANWGASWLLIVLESFRSYSQARFMSWTTIPGLLIFNQSNAIFTPMYLAIRLAVAMPCTKSGDLFVAQADLEAMSVSFIFAYVLPTFAMAMPGISIGRFNTKHIIASWYQQWHVYISLVHIGASRWWSGASDAWNAPLRGEKHLFDNLQTVYMLCMMFAMASLWAPILVSLGAQILKMRQRRELRLRSLLLPPLPWSKTQCRSIFEGGKWLLQWDGIIGGIGSAVWAIALFCDARAVWAPDLSFMSIVETTVWYLFLGGPMGVAVGFLWERDALILVQ